MRAIAGVGLMLALGACGYSVDEVQDAQPRFTVTVPAAWDSVGTCIARFYTDDYETQYLPVASDKRAEIIVKMIGPGIIQYKTIMYVIDIRGDAQTVVTWRARPPNNASSDKRARDLIERCGKV